jgi:prepilin-type N-terminal cleavage/methylation domain-containing protein
MRRKIPDRLGFTVLELLAVVSILAILAALITATSPTIFRTMERSRCISNLRNLHVALGLYLNDQGHWPQVPPSIVINSPEEDAWWRETLKGNMPDRSWHCPTLVRTAKERNMEMALRENHYVPTLFDSGQQTPNKWDNMPWAMEIGNNHGSGLLIVDKSGAVLPYEEFRNRAK